MLHSDQLLVQAAKSGNTDALAEIYEIMQAIFCKIEQVIPRFC